MLLCFLDLVETDLEDLTLDFSNAAIDCNTALRKLRLVREFPGLQQNWPVPGGGAVTSAITSAGLTDLTVFSLAGTIDGFSPDLFRYLGTHCRQLKTLTGLQGTFPIAELLAPRNETDPGEVLFPALRILEFEGVAGYQDGDGNDVVDWLDREAPRLRATRVVGFPASGRTHGIRTWIRGWEDTV